MSTTMRRPSLITPLASREHRPSISSQSRRRSSGGNLGLADFNNKMWSNAVGKSMGLIPGRETAGPLFLMTMSPTFVLLLHHILVDLDGSMALFWYEIRDHGFFSIVFGCLTNFRNVFVWKMIFGFMVLQLVLMKLLPGKEYRGPVTPAGNVPVYKANGFQAYAVTMALFVGGVYTGKFNGGVIFDNMSAILASMNLFALIFCGLLYLKGRYLPSSSDSGTSGNMVFDFYWGTELYPQILGWNIKHFTNCRVGMMFWPLLVVSCAFKQYDMHGVIADSMLVNLVLQLIYITKFFVWETGYLASMDIMHDRAGFYICWGVLCYLPGVYTSHSMFLVNNPNDLGVIISTLLFGLGFLGIYVNYDCDRQRQKFRSEHGRCKVWGKDPVFIEAKYKTETGEVKSSLLLASGWWGISRHFHYLPEILAAAAWTAPVWCTEYLPYFYVPYLALLLTDRAFRDDARCKCKYGKYWDQYCYHVPFMIVPGVV